MLRSCNVFLQPLLVVSLGFSHFHVPVPWQLVEPVVYYQIIDLPLPEFERLVTYRIAFHNSKHDEVATVAVRIAKDRTVGELLEEVRQQLPAKHRPKGPLRLMEIYQWKIWQLFDPEVPIDKSLSMSTDLWHLRAEEVPEDQVDLAKEGQLHVHCLQVQDKDGNDKIVS